MNNTEVSFDKTAWAEQKKAQREAAFARIDAFLEHIPKNPKDLRTYLDVQSRFPQCTVSNAVLIAVQKPDATEYHTFEDWKKRGAAINKGEQGFSMLIPGGSYSGKDGKTHTRFDVQKVFDVSQTSAVLPVRTDNPALILKAMLVNPVVPVRNADQEKGAEFLAGENMISIGRCTDVAEGLQTLSLALAHGELSALVEGYDPLLPENSFHARCASYIFCRHYGIEPKNKSFPELKTVLGSCSVKELRGQLETIRTAAKTLISRVEKAKTAMRNMDREEQDHDSR